MSQLRKTSIFEKTASVCTVACLFASVWMTTASRQGAEQVVMPVTAALTRANTAAPVEFDGMLKSASSELCLDVNAYSAENDFPVQQWDCNDTANQRVWIDSVYGSHAYRLRVQHSGKCLEPTSAQSGATVKQWVCHNGDFNRPAAAADVQHWDINELGGGLYSIVNVNSGLALTTGGTVRGDVFKTKVWTGGNNQKFRFKSVNQHDTNPAVVGSWGELIAWPHVPVHAAVTPVNTVVTWSSNELDNYPQDTGNKFSWSSVYDLDSESFLDTNNPAHDMFCAGTTLLEDGSLMASGGNPRAVEASLFDPQSNSWSQLSNMRQARWYGTNVMTGNGDVFSTFAKGAQQTPELFSREFGDWRDVPGADMSTLRDEQDLGNANKHNYSAELQWYAFMHTSPDGRIFQSGPMKNMHWYGVDDQGSVASAGTRTTDALNRQFGSAVMYDVGKLLLSGGSDPSIDSVLSEDDRSVLLGATDTAMTIDINGAAPSVQEVPPMNSRRANHNAVVLPNGEVYVVGGTEWGLLFDDRYASWWPEIWNPETRAWRNVAALSTPRAYHSWALLLQDGRVLTGGGGLCGDCSANHPDAQIYSPPYLFQSDGQLAERPQIAEGSTQAHVGGLLSFSTNTNISKLTMVRLSSVTHSINNDQRFIELNVEEMGSNLYLAQLSSNVNVMIPGMYWVFAIDDSGVPSTGHLLQIKATASASTSLFAGLLPEHGLTAELGESIRLSLPHNDFDADRVVYSAIGLPDGLTLDEETGELRGSFNSAGKGSFIVSASDGSLQSTERVNYQVYGEEGRVSVSGSGSLALLSLFVLAGFRLRRSH